MFYGKKCRTTQCNKEARQTFPFCDHFIQPSECKYVLFVCLSVRVQVTFIRCVSDTFAGEFLSAQLFYRGDVELCHPLYDFRGKESKLFFADVAYSENLNPRKIITMFFRQTRKILATRKYRIIRYLL